MDLVDTVDLGEVEEEEIQSDKVVLMVEMGVIQV